MKRLYIFDLDGTLADIEHRREALRKTSDWDAFHRNCVDDKPNWPVIVTARMLSEYADILIFSGRSTIVEAETRRWLEEYVGINMYGLFMRIAGDNTADQELKKRWYNEMSSEDKKRLTAVFDDRNKVVRMWRSIGVPCFQVAEYDG